MEEIDIWRAAKQMLDAYGDRAPAIVAARMADFHYRGQSDAVAFWKRVLKALAE